MDKKPKFRGTENPELSKWMHRLGSSSAASPHNPNPRKQRNRAGARGAAIRDQKDNS